MRNKLLLGLIIGIIAITLTGGCGGDDKGPKPLAAVQPSAQVPPAPAKQPAAVNLTPDSKKQLNTFFSNFTEAGVKPFDAGKISEAALIEFGVMHNVINRSQTTQNGKLPAQEVDNACLKYFAIRPKSHQSTQSFQYANSFYNVPRASGEAFRFAQIESLSDKGDGTFAAVVNVFVASSGFTGNPHGTAAEWKASGDTPDLAEKMNAIVKRVNENGTTRWVLVEYRKR